MQKEMSFSNMTIDLLQPLILFASHGSPQVQHHSCPSRRSRSVSDEDLQNSGLVTFGCCYTHVVSMRGSSVCALKL